MVARNISPLTNFEIDDMLQHIPHFRGTFSKDQLPQPQTKQDCMVINLEDFADGNGSHWTCVFGNEYFDSFGLPPPDVVRDWMLKKNKQVLYNSSKLQKDESVLCGLFCIYFIKERFAGRSAVDVLLDFTQHPSQWNEALIKDNYK